MKGQKPEEPCLYVALELHDENLEGKNENNNDIGEICSREDRPWEDTKMAFSW